jgi:MtrB/PioB family decaheme-associated outer membrane protein
MIIRHRLRDLLLASRRLALAAAGLAGVMTMAVAADADPEAEALADLVRPQSRIELGVGVLSAASFAAGNYSGLDRKGAYLIGSFDLRGNQYRYLNPDDDGTRWRLAGNNLGLDGRALWGELGKQSRYRLTFGFETIPRLNSDSYQTPFLGGGTDRLALPGGFQRGATTAAMANLTDSAKAFNVESRRQHAEVGGSWWLNSDWELRGSLRNDDRDGTRLRGLEFGFDGGPMRSALLPEPINNRTQLIDASLAWTGEDQRMIFTYHGSLFRNHLDSLVWDNPYSNAPWVGGNSGLPADFPLASGRASLAPDNQFHQLGVTGAVDFSATTRLTVTANRGRMTQNQAFLPYTITPGLADTGLPRASLGGLVETTFLQSRLAMRPIRPLSLSAGIRYEDRDNRTPQSEYLYVGGDVLPQPARGTASDEIRTNLPHSRRLLQITAEADYRLSPRAAVKAGWENESIRRTFSEVERTSENTYRLEIRQTGAGEWTANGGLALLQRRGTQYLFNAPYLASYTSAALIAEDAAANHCTSPIDCIRLGPLQKKFFLADRDRRRVRLAMGYTPDVPLSLQFRLDGNDDRYPQTDYGVNRQKSWSASTEVSVGFNEDFNATLFYTFDNQQSRERTRQVIDTTRTGTPDSDWVNQLADRTSSFGFALRHKGLLGGKLDLNLDGIMVRSRTPIATSVGAAIGPGQNPAGALPDLIARSENINLTARYALDRQTTLRAAYSYRHLNSADWALQQVTLATLAGMIGTNERVPRYTVHGVAVSFVRTFR